MPKLTEDMIGKARSEGWLIAETGLGFELQRRDEDPVFSNDDEAAAHVKRQAQAGISHAVAAIQFLVDKKSHDVSLFSLHEVFN